MYFLEHSIITHRVPGWPAGPNISVRIKQSTLVLVLDAKCTDTLRRFVGFQNVGNPKSRQVVYNKPFGAIKSMAKHSWPRDMISECCALSLLGADSIP